MFAAVNSSIFNRNGILGNKGRSLKVCFVPVCDYKNKNKKTYHRVIMTMANSNILKLQKTPRVKKMKLLGISNIAWI